MNKDEVTKLFDENTYPEWSQLECFRKGFALATVIRDKEWMAEPVQTKKSGNVWTAHIDPESLPDDTKLYAQPKEVK